MLFAGATTFAQNNPESVWVKLDNQNLVQMGANGVRSSNAELQTIINSFDVHTIQPVLSNSRNSENLKINEVKCDCDVQDLYKALAETQSISLRPELGPDYQLLYTPDDYTLNYSEDWALNQVRAEEAWAISKGDTNIVIAITDSHYDLTHEEFIGKLDTIIPTAGNIYHGTAVATTAAGATDNGIGKSAIGFKSKLQLRPMTYNEILGATYSGADIVNISWYSTCNYSQYVQDVMNEVYNNGTVIIAAAGNGTTCGNPSAYVYPAACDNVFSVTSIGEEYNHEHIIGDPTSTHQHNDRVDLAAPGYDVPLTMLAGYYSSSTGTSFAAPMVSGTAALILSLNPCLTPGQVYQILKHSARDISQLNPGYAIGSGALDALAALELTIQAFPSPELSTEINCLTGLGTATIDWPNAPTAYEANWSNGTTANTINNLNTGMYSVQVDDATGCSYNFDFLIEETEILHIAPVTFNPTCANDANGSIHITTSTPGLTFNCVWSDGQTTNPANNLGSGTYFLEAISNTSCVYRDTFIIQAPSPIGITSTISPNNANIDVTGGTAPYAFNWSNGFTTEDLNNVPSGSYTLDLTDANGCSETITVTVPFGSLDSLQASLDGLNIDGITIYPNPSNGMATIDLNKVECDLIQVFSISGQLVQSIPVTQEQEQIQVSNIASGSYLVKVINKSATLKTLRLQVNL